MNKNVYVFWPIRLKRNKAMFGKRKGHIYWRFGLGSRWESGWHKHQDAPGSKRLLGWSFFIGPYRLAFGKHNMLAELDAMKS